MAPPGVANCAGAEPNEADAGAPTEPAMPVSLKSGGGGTGGDGMLADVPVDAAGLIPPPPPPPQAVEKAQQSAPSIMIL